jgi:hypothetical protein
MLLDSTCYGIVWAIDSSLAMCSTPVPRSVAVGDRITAVPMDALWAA